MITVFYARAFRIKIAEYVNTCPCIYTVYIVVDIVVDIPRRVLVISGTVISGTDYFINNYRTTSFLSFELGLAGCFFLDIIMYSHFVAMSFR